MVSHILRSIAFVAVIGTVAEASAQQVAATAVRVTREAWIQAAYLDGTVRDETGAIVAGASVLAEGPALALATSDGRGRFSLLLPAGDYTLRASHAGHLAAYYESVRLYPSRRLVRPITLRRAEQPTPSELSAPPAPAVPPPDAVDQPGDSEIAWRLRHLRRTVLRDVGSAAVPEGAQDSEFGSAGAADVSLLEWALYGSARAAGSFLANSDFTGQVNLLTVSSVATSEGQSSKGWSHGIADVTVGAPVGATGDWWVRGAMANVDAASWTFMGQYQARESQSHGLRLAVSYSSQGLVTGRGRPTFGVVPESRSVGGMTLSDRWQVRPSVEVDYGLEFDRYDYLSSPNLFSSRAGARVRVLPRTFVVASASQRMSAPGADQFLPPSEAGPWLPPTRTFSALAAGVGMRPERIRHRAVGVEQEFERVGALAVAVQRFSQSTTDQLAVLFGLDEASELGHYYVATAGTVDVVGWRVRVHGTILRHVTGSVGYARGRAQWDDAGASGELRRHQPSFARRGSERLSDLDASLDATVPSTATRVALGYRLTRAAPREDGAGSPAIASGRFRVVVRQRLPYQPLDASTLNLFLTLRTMLHDDASGSIYDELMTVGPPTRLTGGVQVKF